jgi:O-antigen/teichoic acid export membrane protein
MSKNYFYNVLISVTNILFPILTFPYASHILGPAGIGKVQFVISFAQYFALFAALGIPLYGITETARFKENKNDLSKVFSELVLLHTLVGLIFSIIYFSVILLHPFFKPDIHLYMAAGLIILLGFTSVDWFYSGIEKYSLIAFRSVFIKLLAVISLYVLVKSAGDYFNYLLILLFSLLGNNFISLLLIGRHTKLKLRGISFKKHLKPVMYILGSNIAINMYTIWDMILLGFLSNAKTVGLYFAAVKLVKIAIPFIISMGTSIIPRLTQKFNHNDISGVKHLLSESFHFTVLIAVPLVVGMALLAPEFVETFSGKEFNTATSTMQVLSILPLVIGLGHFFSMQILVPAGLNHQMFLSTLAGAACSLFLNLLLVPFFDAVGAGIANISAELIVTGLYFYYVRKNFSFDIKWNLLLKALICSMFFLPTVYIIRQYIGSVYLILIFSVILCFIQYFVLQWVIYKDQMLLKITRPIRVKNKKLPI